MYQLFADDGNQLLPQESAMEALRTTGVNPTDLDLDNEILDLEKKCRYLDQQIIIDKIISF